MPFSSLPFSTCLPKHTATMLPKPFTPLALSLAALRTATASSIFTGDVLNGHPVISHLDLSQVSSCNVTRYYLRLPDLAGDSAQHLPIFVARGPEETLETGTKLSISASIHGNELNPVRVAQKTLEWLEGNVETLNGTGELLFHYCRRRCRHRH